MATTRPRGSGEHHDPVGRRTRLLAILVFTATTLHPGPVAAADLRLDTSLPGADFDAILDGFPGLAALDGAGDLPGNALAVSLRDGVTEERAILELPLAPLTSAGVGAARIASATLHFNIDDVLTTFGPGTDFDGTGAEHIHVSTYAGDGVVDLPDFARGTAAATVTTGPNGSITDASVRIGGPIDFAVDLTASVKQLVAAGATHVGLVLSTDDSPTGTSIDDRGDGGTGAPGTGGATMPYLVVVTVDATPPTPPPATPSATPTSTATTTPPIVTPSPAPTSPPAPTPSPVVTGTPVPTITGGPVFTSTPAATGATPSPGPQTPQPSGTPTPTSIASSSPATPTPRSSTSPATTPTSVPTATPSPGAGVTPTPRPVLTPSPPRATTSPGTTPSPATDGELETLRPDASGDQLVFYYDARDGFTTFLSLHNLGSDSLRVRIVLCDAVLTPQITQDVDLAAGATRTVDVASLRVGGLPAGYGAVHASAIDAEGRVRVSRALAGSFTVANLATGSAWGAPAAARRAVAVIGDAVTGAPLGTVIDGSSVRLQGIAPDQLDLAVFYDPATLEPAARGGNQILLLSFADDGSALVTAGTSWQLDARRADGTRLPAESVTISGVTSIDLATLLGPAVEGEAGSIHFRTTEGAQNRLIFFVESLGTFATGYLLPPVTP